MATQLSYVGLAVLGGLGLFTIFLALAMPRLRLRRAQAATWLDGIQVRLARAGLDIAAPTFLLNGALIGAGMGALASLIVGTFVVFLPFLLGGYVVLWAALEDQRSQAVNQYHHDLATAMGIIVNAWKSSPSLSGALEAVAEYGPGGALGEGALRENSVAADFDTILRGLRAGSALRDLLQEVADQRTSPLFDGLATALLVAEEQGSEASAMLERQSVITQRQVDVFNEALAKQRQARNEVRNGTLGPWVILGLVQLLGVLGAGGMDTSFFRQPAGAITAVLCALATIGMYAQAMRIAGRELLMTRVPTEHGRQERD